MKTNISVEEQFNYSKLMVFNVSHKIEINISSLDVEKLLRSPILKHNGTDIKFKRTKQLIDKTSFILKTSIQNEDDKITPSRMNLYASTLIGNSLTSTTSDCSTDNEQIILVQCNDEIGEISNSLLRIKFEFRILLDFDKVRQGHKSKPQLYGKLITLIQIHECDALEIRYNEENKSITNDDLERIFNSVWEDIFAFHFPTDDYAEVEFINVPGMTNFEVSLIVNVLDPLAHFLLSG